MWETSDRGHRSWMRTGTPSICQAIFQGVEGAEWETMYSDHKELHKAAKGKKSGDVKKAKALWSSKEARDKGRDCYDLGSVQQIRARSQVRLDALERTEHNCGLAQ